MKSGLFSLPTASFTALALLLCCRSAGAQQVHRIEQLRDARDVEAFLRWYDESRFRGYTVEPTLPPGSKYDCRLSGGNGRNVDVWPKVADTLGAPAFDTADFDGNGRTDLLVSGGRWEKRSQFSCPFRTSEPLVVLNFGPHRYRLCWLESGMHSYPKAVREGGQTLLVNFVTRPTLWLEDIERLKADTLVYCNGRFVNRKLTGPLRIERIRMVCGGGYRNPSCWKDDYDIALYRYWATCWECDQYEVSLDRTGAAVLTMDYIRQDTVAGRLLFAKDRYRCRVPRSTVRRLSRRLLDLNFPFLPTSPRRGLDALQSSQDLEITYNGGQVTTISNYLGATPDDLRQVLDVLDDLRWRRGWKQE